MTREELEQMIDYQDLYLSNGQSLKDFIFETIIPEVLKSIIDNIDKDSKKSKMYWLTTNDIKQKAKELYGIDL